MEYTNIDPQELKEHKKYPLALALASVFGGYNEVSDALKEHPVYKDIDSYINSFIGCNSTVDTNPIIPEEDQLKACEAIKDAFLFFTSSGTFEVPDPREDRAYAKMVANSPGLTALETIIKWND